MKRSRLFNCIGFDINAFRAPLTLELKAEIILPKQNQVISFDVREIKEITSSY